MSRITFQPQADDYVDLLVQRYNMSKGGKRERLVHTVVPVAIPMIVAIELFDREENGSHCKL